MASTSQEAVDSSIPSSMEDSTKALLREFAASLCHTHSVICRLLEDAGDTEPLPSLIFRDFIPPSLRWYAMIAGPNPGIYQGLQNVPNRAVSSANVGQYSSEEEARRVFDEALDNGGVKRISDGTVVVLTRDDVYGV